MKQNTLTCLIYGRNGSGKSVGGMSLLKIPHLKLRIMALDANALYGIDDAIRIHGITPKAGQLTICQPKMAVVDAKATFKAVMLGASPRGAKTPKELIKARYESVVNAFDNFEGIDYATGETVSHGSVYDWGRDDVLIVDGLSTITEIIEDYERIKLRNPNDVEAAVNGWDFTRNVQDKVNQFAEFLCTPTMISCNVVMYGHEKRTTHEVTKEERITLSLVGQKGVSMFMGKFATILYAECVNTVKGKAYYWNNLKAGTDAVARGIPKSEKLDYSKLVPDFSLAEYDFF